jgi:hypothetical protein
MKLLFTNDWLRRKILSDPDDEPSAGGEPEPIDWKAAYVEALRQRDALTADAERYRYLRGLNGDALDLAVDLARTRRPAPAQEGER